MMEFLKLFIAVLLLAGIPLGLWLFIDRSRGKRQGCSGNHDCVVYKGERLMCPSCELREQQAAAKKAKSCSSCAPAGARSEG